MATIKVRITSEAQPPYVFAIDWSQHPTCIRLLMGFLEVIFITLLLLSIMTRCETNLYKPREFLPASSSSSSFYGRLCALKEICSNLASPCFNMENFLFFPNTFFLKTVDPF